MSVRRLLFAALAALASAAPHGGYANLNHNLPIDRRPSSREASLVARTAGSLAPAAPVVVGGGRYAIPPPMYAPPPGEYPTIPHAPPPASSPATSPATSPAAPAAGAPMAPGLPVKAGLSPCNADRAWLAPTHQSWNDSGTDQFLQQWLAEEHSIYSQANGGFTGAFANWALGTPQVTCQLDGSTDCNFDDVCDNQQFLKLGNDSVQAYNVLQGMQHLRSYMQGLQTSFSEAAILGALSTDDWVETFYTNIYGQNGDDTSTQGIEGLLQVINALTTVFAVAMVFLAPEALPAVVAAEVAATAATTTVAKGVASALFGGAMNAATIAFTHMPNHGGPDNFRVASDVGKSMATVIQNSLNGLVANNNILMSGGTVNTTMGNGTATANLGDYLQGGVFSNSSLSEVDAMTGINTMLQSMAINQMWRRNKIFVLGGGKCGDGQGIGTGSNMSWCDPATNTAWYIYFWQLDSNKIVLTHHKWGWVTAPPGADQLGSGPYANITVANAIESSVRAYAAGGYNYTADVFQDRIADAVTHGWANPMADGAAWEGLFTIPVCNVSWAINNTSLQGKNYILEPYNNHESRLQWCGPICNNDLHETQLFINATNMENFKSPYVYCSKDPGLKTIGAKPAS